MYDVIKKILTVLAIVIILTGIVCVSYVCIAGIIKILSLILNFPFTWLEPLVVWILIMILTLFKEDDYACN